MSGLPSTSAICASNSPYGRPAVDGVSFHGRRERCGVLGPYGCGKTGRCAASRASNISTAGRHRSEGVVSAPADGVPVPAAVAQISAWVQS